MNLHICKVSLRAALLATALSGMCAILGNAQAESAAPLVGSSVGAIGHSSAGSTIPAEESVRTQLRAAIADLISNGAFGSQSPHDISLDIDAPGQQVTDLGVLVDSSRNSAVGLHVLGITPGSAAEKMGLRAGDVLIAANGIALGGSGAAAAANLRQSVDHLQNGGTLAFDLDRAGRPQTVSGPLTSVYVPAIRLHVGDAVQVASAGSGAVATTAPDQQAAAGCGRISDFDVAPRQQQLHAARIILIDGQTPGPGGVESFRVTAGQHVLTVANRIESRYLAFNDMQRNAGMSSSHYKKLTIEIAPNTTTLIAARLNDDKRNEWQHDAYWDPVAWKEVAETCR